MIMRKKIISIIAILCIMASVLVPLAADSDTGTEYNLMNGSCSVYKSAPGYYVYTEVALFDNQGQFLTYSNHSNWNDSFCSAQDYNATSGTWYWQTT